MFVHKSNGLPRRERVSKPRTVVATLQHVAVVVAVFGVDLSISDSTSWWNSFLTDKTFQGIELSAALLGVNVGDAVVRNLGYVGFRLLVILDVKANMQYKRKYDTRGIKLLGMPCILCTR